VVERFESGREFQQQGKVLAAFCFSAFPAGAIAGHYISAGGAGEADGRARILVT